MIQEIKVKTGNFGKCENENVEEMKYIPNGDVTNDIQKLQLEKSVRKPDTFFLYFTVIIGTIPLLVGGTALAWLTPTLGLLQSNNTEINPLDKPITTVEISLLAGLPTLIGLVGCLFVPKLADYIGRKKFILIMGVGMLVTYLAKAFSHRVIYLVIYRCAFIALLNGQAIVLQMYIAEICEDHNRAKYMCLKSLFFPLGNVYAYVLGPYFNFMYFNIICGLPLVVFFILFLLAPESPVYSLSKGDSVGCMKALKILRSNKNIKELDTDLNKLTEMLNMTECSTTLSFLALFKTKEARTATKLMIFLSILEYSSGVTALATFLGPLLHAAGTDYSENIMTITVGMTQVISLYSTSFFIEKIGRKDLLVFSSFGCGIFLFFFGSFYYLKANDFLVVSKIQWLPIVCIIAYFYIFAVGLDSLPVTIITEIFPSNLVSTALPCAITVMTLTIFLLNFIYPIIVESVGVHWCLWGYSISCLVGGILVSRIVPETNGKSSVEIQEMLKQY